MSIILGGYTVIHIQWGICHLEQIIQISTARMPSTIILTALTFLPLFLMLVEIPPSQLMVTDWGRLSCSEILSE
jgi:hypothetical protein